MVDEIAVVMKKCKILVLINFKGFQNLTSHREVNIYIKNIIEK